jgi:hypothetical protein
MAAVLNPNKDPKAQERKIKAKRDKFYRAVGVCITRWASVDRALFEMFHTALGIDPRRASIIYFRAVTLGPQLQLTDLIVTATLAQLNSRDPAENAKVKKEQDEWDAIEKILRLKLVPIRNFLCHESAADIVTTTYEISGSPGPRVHRIKDVKTWTQLENRRHKPPKAEPPLGPLKSDDLKKHYDALVDIEDRLIGVRNRIRALLLRAPPGPLSRRYAHPTAPSRPPKN